MPKRSNKKQARKNGNKVGTREQSGYSVKTHFGPLRAPPVPRNFAVSLREQVEISMGGTLSAPQFNLFGLLEPLARNPTYMTNYFDMYKYMRIKAVEVTVNFSNTTLSRPVSVLVTTLPHSDVGITSYSQAAEQPQCTQKLLSALGGQDRVQIKKTYSCLDLVGSYGGDKWWITQAQSVSSSPIDPREPVLVLAAKGLAISYDWTAIAQLNLVYHVEFFDLQSTA